MSKHQEFTRQPGQIVADVSASCLSRGIPPAPAPRQDWVVNLIQHWEGVGEAETLSVFDRLVAESVHQVPPGEWIGVSCVSGTILSYRAVN